jgi:hypothetical protein
MPVVIEKVLPMSPVHLLPMSPVYTGREERGPLWFHHLTSTNVAS